MSARVTQANLDYKVQMLNRYIGPEIQLRIESYDPGDGRRWRVELEKRGYVERTLTPYLFSRAEVMLYLDGFDDALGLAKDYKLDLS